MQEAQRVKYRVGRLPEGFEQRGERRLGSTRALGMPAHAVDYHQQHGLFSGGNGDAILIFFAVSDQADVRGLDLQWKTLDATLCSPLDYARFWRRPL